VLRPAFSVGWIVQSPSLYLAAKPQNSFANSQGAQQSAFAVEYLAPNNRSHLSSAKVSQLSRPCRWLHSKPPETQ
jgi:hypothetical protein